jgi:hypothetical protein
MDSRKRAGACALVAVLLALGALATGCERKRRPRVAQRPPQEPDASVLASGDVGGASVAPTTEPPQIKLLDPGGEPRASLRYHLASGQRETIDVTMRIRASHKLAEEQPPELRLPAFRLTIQVAIAEKMDGDKARSEFRIADAEITDDEGVDAMLVSSTRADLEKITGMNWTAVVDARGFRRNTRMDVPAGASDQIKQIIAGATTTLDQLSSLFPVEPVGVGARWEHYQTLAQNGMQVRLTANLELAEVDGDHGLLKAFIKQAADRQPAFLPGLPMGVEAELLSFSGSGEASIEFDLSRQVPQRAEIDMATESEFSIRSGGQAQPMTQSANVEMIVESVTP